MVIQRVITMSDDTFTQPGHAGAPPGDAEYNAVYAAVTATERGRWFLAEFANRTRKADTDVILAAIARVEAAIQSGAAPQAALQREALAVTSAAMVPASAREDERDEPAVGRAPANSAASVPAPAEIVQDRREQDRREQDKREQERGGRNGDEDAQTLSDRDYSDAVAAIAASLTTRLEESSRNLARENAVEERAHGESAREPAPSNLAGAAETAMPAVGAMRPGRASQDNSPRWHIDSPDFVFGAANQGETMPGSEPQPATAQMQSQLLGAEIMGAEAWEAEVKAQSTSQGDAPPAAREEPSRLETAIDVRPVAAAAASPVPSPAASSPELDIVPFTETARPQLRVAREAMPGQRAPRYGSLTVTDALSEDEVIALFG